MDALPSSAHHRDASATLRRTLGLDVGDYCTGVALSEPMGLLARSLVVIQSRRWAVQVAQIADLVVHHEVGTIVLGYPLHMSGEAGEQARRVDRFADLLAEELARRGWSAEVAFWDERFTTEIAEDIRRQNLSQRGARSGGRAGRGARVDATAAAVILQSYLDHLLSRRVSEAPGQSV